MMSDAKLKARDTKRNIGSEMLAAVQELKAGQARRKTLFEPLPDGSVRRTVLLADGAVHSAEVLEGPQWQLLAARTQAGMSQSEFCLRTAT